MAIFDSEKRPRGLRVPSLTAMKSSAAAKSQFSFHSKKSTESVPSEESQVKAAPPPPPKPAPPPNKELPIPPQDLPAIPAPSQLTENPYFPSIRDAQERRPIQRVPVPAPAPAPAQAPAPAPAKAPSPRATGLRNKASQPDLRVQEPTPPMTLPPAPQYPTPQPSPQPAAQEPQEVREVQDEPSPQPEDFIPTPDSAEPNEIPSARSEDTSPYVAPDFEPVAPSLNKTHLTCYQEHRAMPIAQNKWCPMPCMTCNKFDTEIRHRCVFCCLRVCEGCYQMLQKCKNRSVEELVDRIA
ncbi:uncharacterized protein N7506_009185 [Penicillium brevicompactum]|uniref:uncharacterized protein n=1 Tax=Penicillium brevicompactum TaxID=5074 RepID=UPI0025416996|nr:uncharacterized protein N7506_009185 [Penicillium brevicompactum]KAJ5326083.1 hypothetical protein N7506_009185 [Penicillium brevicompactum]